MCLANSTVTVIKIAAVFPIWQVLFQPHKQNQKRYRTSVNYILLCWLMTSHIVYISANWPSVLRSRTGLLSVKSFLPGQWQLLWLKMAVKRWCCWRVFPLRRGPYLSCCTQARTGTLSLYRCVDHCTRLHCVRYGVTDLISPPSAGSGPGLVHHTSLTHTQCSCRCTRAQGFTQYGCTNSLSWPPRQTVFNLIPLSTREKDNAFSVNFNIVCLGMSGLLQTTRW